MRASFAKTFGLGAVEALLLASKEPVAIARITDTLEGLYTANDIQTFIDQLRLRYETSAGIMLTEVAGGYQLCTRPEMAEYCERVVRERLDEVVLSGAARETVAIIAYRQPVTRAQIEQFRGVKVDKVLQTLLDHELIREAGRKEEVGRPILYETTKTFLRHFGLKSLDDLPPMRPSSPEAIAGLAPALIKT